MIKRTAIVGLVAIVFVLGTVFGAHRDWVRDSLSSLSATLASLLGTNELEPPRTVSNNPDREVTRVNSGLLNFDLTMVKSPGLSTDAGGGLGLVEGGLVIAHNRDGSVDYYDVATDSMRVLRFRLPSLNREALPQLTPDGLLPDNRFIRYQDVEIFPQPDGEHIAIHHDYYDAAHSCFVTRLEAAKLPDDWRESLTEGETPQLLDWQLLVETSPCLFDADGRPGSNETGGRILVESLTTLLLTTGNLDYDGTDNRHLRVSQMEGSLWGRVLRIDLVSDAVTEVSRGHRNPQGMTRDVDGVLWSVEHGPRGGDELNIVRQGTNYGWPDVTLGVDYTSDRNDAKLWPNSVEQGRHNGFSKPVFAWMPSIAPSSIKLISGLHERWDGDLLISTLADESLHRLRLEGQRVLYDEPINLGRRIRDIEIADGRIYIMFDDGSLGYMVPRSTSFVSNKANTSDDAITVSGCLTCHSRADHPRLEHVLGSDIASQSGIRYSDSLKAVEGTWSRERLDAFLADPDVFAPGTTMPSPGLTEANRSAVLDALEEPMT